ncbi:MAG: ribonuclease P protein component [Flavobacterium sp. BFFFF2]|nr:MAG: ribonuclease P protein component [Flavobacterium sp. BFFFF2]
MQQTYPSTEKLKQKTHISSLFQEGKSVSASPLRLIFLPLELADSPIKFGVSVPKKHHKKAVDRNYLKRVLRECYRKNKSLLLPHVGQGFLFMMVYQSAETLTYAEIELKTQEVFQKWTLRK